MGCNGGDQKIDVWGVVVDNLFLFFTHVGYNGVIGSHHSVFWSVLLSDKMLVVVMVIKAATQLIIECGQVLLIRFHVVLFNHTTTIWGLW